MAMFAASWNRVLGADDRISHGTIGTGNRGQDVMSIKSRKSPDSNVADGHRSAVASHPGNIAYQKKKRLQLEIRNGEERVIV